MTGPVCSLDGCGQPAVLSWLRAGTDDEATGRAAELCANQQTMVDYARTQVAAAIADLTGRLNGLQTPVPTLDPVLQRQLVTQTEQRIAAAQQQLTDLVDPVPPTTPEPVRVAVYGCSEHAVSEVAATMLHQSDCRPCGCTLSEPVATPEPATPAAVETPAPAPPVNSAPATPATPEGTT